MTRNAADPMSDPAPITFSFGENWQSFLRGLSEQAVQRAIADTVEWLPDAEVKGRSILDAGCGSGLHSLAFQVRGAQAITSFDRDPASVAATRSLWEKAGSPSHWRVLEGSILDRPFIASQVPDQFDVVYSWGVLHHTGAMWEALANVTALVKPGGWLWISLYAKGGRYARDLALKQRYNAASRIGRWWMERRFILRLMRQRLRQGENPFTWNAAKERGMDTWHDIVDWLGGLPYETASVDEIVAFASANGLVLKKIKAALEGGCHIFLLRKERPG